MYTFDHDLFMRLNFDGGTIIDRVMFIVSGMGMWISLYVLMLWLVWRREGWRNALFFLALALAAIGLADLIAAIFKHSGPLENLLPDFTARPRPMFTPSLEGLDITPDSLRVIRRAGLINEWAVHIPRKAIGGLYGTVSGHAATIFALTVFSCQVIRRRWFTWLMIFCTVLICYSRIYLGKHFPLDLAWGALVGIVFGYAALRGYRQLTRPK